MSDKNRTVDMREKVELLRDDLVKCRRAVGPLFIGHADDGGDDAN